MNIVLITAAIIPLISAIATATYKIDLIKVIHTYALNNLLY